MKTLRLVLLIGVMALALFAAGDRALALGSGGAFVDNFNDGVIGDAWHSLATDGSSIYEANDVLTMVSAAGPLGGGLNQVVDVNSKTEFLAGDIDVQVEFQLDPEFHNQFGNAAQLSVGRKTDEWGKERDCVGINIHRYGYTSWEEHQGLSGASYHQDYAWTASSDLHGKVRIKRTGNLITTYYWDHGWVQQSQWETYLLTGSPNLELRLMIWNWDPFPSFWVKWDNLIALYHPAPPK